MSISHRRYRVEVWDIMQLLFGRFNDHQVRCVIQFAGHVDEGRLKRAVDLSADVFSIIGCNFVEGGGRPYWEDGGFTADDMVHLEITESVDETLQTLLPFKTGESSGPQLRINVVRGSEADSLCVIMNHMVCDAAGMKEYLYLLASIYAGLTNSADYKPDYVMGSRSCGQLFESLGWGEKARVLFDRYQLSKHDSGVVFGLDGDADNPFIVTHTLSRDRFRSINAFAKRHGATVNDVVLAAYIRSLHGILGRTVAIPCTVDLRKYLPGKKAAGICNLTSQLICDIGQDIGEGLCDTLVKVKHAMDADKERLGCLHAIALLEVIFGSLPYAVAKGLIARVYVYPPIAMTNIGIVDKERLTFGDVEATNAFMTGSIKYKPHFQIALSSFDGEVTFSTNSQGTERDRERIGQFLWTLDGELP